MTHETHAGYYILSNLYDQMFLNRVLCVVVICPDGTEQLTNTTTCTLCAQGTYRQRNIDKINDWSCTSCMQQYFTTVGEGSVVEADCSLRKLMRHLIMSEM